MRSLLPRRRLSCGRLQRRDGVQREMRWRLRKAAVGEHSDDLAGPAVLRMRRQQPPSDKRVPDEGLQHRHDGILVAPQQAHHQLACVPVVPLDARNLQRIQEHPCQPEGYPLRIFLTECSYLEAVAKVDMHHLPTFASNQQVRRVPVPQAKDVAHDGHHSQAAAVRGTATQPDLAIPALQPKYALKIDSRGAAQGMAENLDLLQDAQVLIP
mmetsp:Transcript_30908/g.88624  ORF Transcript_30908/g.88624 Transcript_30908/m.88624 type:complete len:211 (+) Transcript_30908:86-718(+)